MKPLYARDLTAKERTALQEGLMSSSAYTVRRCQILLKSADDHLKAQTIAAHLCCSDQTVREAIRDFESGGLASLEEGSHAPKKPDVAFDEDAAEQLEDIVHQRPRDFDVARTLWTLHDLR